MIDTIGVQFPIEIDKSTLSPLWGYERKPVKSGFYSCYRIIVAAQNGCPVTFRYIPHTPKGYPLLQVEFSLPHLVFGDNVYMVNDIEGVITQANLMLPSVFGIPEINLWKGMLYRLDICFNFQVGTLVPFYIQALQHLEFSRRKTQPYSRQGVQFFNKQVALKVYNKEQVYIDKKLPENQSSRGILRMEITLRKNAVKRLTKLKYPTLQDISINMILDALKNELSHLGLLNSSIGTYDSTLKTLCDAYGTDAGFCYFGALAAMVEYPSRQTVFEASRIHPRTLDRRLKKVLKAGLPLTMTKTDSPLPPLFIDIRMVTDKTL